MAASQSTSRLELELAVRAALPNGASVEAVAALLGVSPRTLQRRLAAHGLTLSELVSRQRRQRAIELLAEVSLSITQIAYRVGFANLSSFSRAFHTWTGYSPRAYRDQQVTARLAHQAADRAHACAEDASLPRRRPEPEAAP